MSQFHLTELLQATGGKVLSQHQELFDGVGSDTRVYLDRQLFVALKGDQFDAHQFLTKAVEQGAAALLVHEETKELAQLKDKVTVVLVKDTLLALQSLANFHRKRSKSVIVGIAGSNGKTTSKEFCASLLSAFRNVHYSKGSFNNHWGVPFTLLAEPENTEVSIVEMGMNDIVMTERISGTPLSIMNTDYAKQIGLKQNFIERFLNGHRHSKKLFKTFTQLKGLKNLEHAVMPGSYKTLWSAGQSVEMIESIKPCRTIIDDLISETKVAFEELKSQFQL